MPPAKIAPKAAQPPPKPRTKHGLIADIATACDLEKGDVTKVLATLGEFATADLTGKRSPGKFVIPGLVMFKVARRGATKERKGVNPFTKEDMTIAARPARNVIKATPAKAIKDRIV